MDIVISKKKQQIPKIYWIVAGLAIPLFFGVKYLWYLGQADFSVPRESIVVDEVQRGRYTVSVRGTGVLVPDNVQWLSANVEGTVVLRHVRAGHTVDAGDVIIELSNPQLEQQLEESQWELEALSEQLKADQVAQESEMQQMRANVLTAKLDRESAELEYSARKVLVKTGAVSKLDFERSRLAASQSEERLHAAKEELKKMEENLAAQNNARAARYNQLKKSVERIQRQVDDLRVIATMESIVLDMPLELGQRVIMGDKIAKLARMDSLIAELRVPEIQIRDVAIGQRVLVDTRNSKIEGKVSRVDPAVQNGTVQVDVAFSGELPSDARPDLSVDGEIKITEIDNTLYVNRPLFSQSQSRSKFYRLSNDGDFAERVEVTVGYGSVNQIQIVDGLRVGDRIVTSDPTRFESYDKFRIN